jgi:thiamine pyrophosphokinase
MDSNMKLTKELGDKAEWVVVGPMGPALPDFLSVLPVLAVDGGAHWTKLMNVWVGDSDSYKKIPESSLVFHLPENKDASDFSYALKLFDRQKSYHIHLWGFSGGRKDHELFVWGEILAWLEKHPECKFSLYDQSGRIEFHFMGSGHWRFEHRGVFSLGSIRKIRVKLTGEVRYPIAAESWLPSLSSLGLSNEGMGEVILENEGTVFIHYPVEEK